MTTINEIIEECKAISIDYNTLMEKSLKTTEQLLGMEKFIDANFVIQQLLRVEPENKQALQLQGLAYFGMKKYEEGIKALKTAIKIYPEIADNYNNLALCYLHSGTLDKALEAILKALELAPNNANFLNNRALVYRQMGEPLRAISTHEKALEGSNDTQTYQMIGSIYGQLKRYPEAIEALKKSLLIDPDNLATQVDLAYAYHLTGQWEKAWPHYESRLAYWFKTGRQPGRFYEIYKPDKAWNGEDSLEGKTISLYCEQGIGDIIHFCRFVRDLKQKYNVKILIHVPENVAVLIKTINIDGEDGEIGEVRTGYGSEKEYDYHASLLSLPYLLKLSVSEYRRDKPYLFADAEPFLDMSDYKDFYKIGLVWAGNPGHPNDRNRSVNLNQFRVIGKLEGVKLFSLQKDTNKRKYHGSNEEIDLCAGCEDMKLVDMSPYMTDFAATASIINEMDLIISVDTSVLHLAGALGKKTYALIPHNPDWRWTEKGSENVWYSSIELFRQETPGVWDDVLARVIERVKLNLEVEENGRDSI